MGPVSVKAQVSHQLLELGVLPLERLEFLGLISTQAAVLLAPPVVRRLGDADALAHQIDGLALAKLHLRLAKPTDDLLGRMSLLCHLQPPKHRPRLSLGLDWI